VKLRPPNEAEDPIGEMSMKSRTTPVFLAFLAMGFGDAVGPFMSLAKKEFLLSNSAASLIPFVGLSMYGVLSIPTGILQSRYGKKPVLMAGLLLTLVGVLNASFGLTSFERFLLTVVLLGSGATIIQVSGNPMMRDVSAEGETARNLVLGQFVKALGSLSGPLIPVVAARYMGLSWRVIFPVYSVALILIILAATTLRFRRDENNAQAATLRSCLKLLENGYARAMVIAIFLYVGAEVCVSAGIPLLLKERFGVDVARVGLLGTGLFFITLTAGRFCGGLILKWIAPSLFWKISCAVSLIGLLALFSNLKGVAVAGLLLTGLGFANIFPLVFSAALDRMPKQANELSGLMVTAIVGGAVLPLLMGLIADHSSVVRGFVVPLACILYVSAVAMLTRYDAAISKAEYAS
jgi:fucose permease